jgi:hypothetical protein
MWKSRRIATSAGSSRAINASSSAVFPAFDKGFPSKAAPESVVVFMRLQG